MYFTHLCLCMRVSRQRARMLSWSGLTLASVYTRRQEQDVQASPSCCRERHALPLRSSGIRQAQPKSLPIVVRICQRVSIEDQPSADGSLGLVESPDALGDMRRYGRRWVACRKASPSRMPDDVARRFSHRYAASQRLNGVRRSEPRLVTPGCCVHSVHEVGEEDSDCETLG